MAKRDSQTKRLLPQGSRGALQRFRNIFDGSLAFRMLPQLPLILRGPLPTYNALHLPTRALSHSSLPYKLIAGRSHVSGASPSSRGLPNQVPTIPLPRVEPARCGGRGCLWYSQFASPISFPVFQAFARFPGLASNNDRRKHLSQWQEIGGEYRRRHEPPTSGRHFHL